MLAVGLRKELVDPVMGVTRDTEKPPHKIALLMRPRADGIAGEEVVSVVAYHWKLQWAQARVAAARVRWGAGQCWAPAIVRASAPRH